MGNNKDIAVQTKQQGVGMDIFAEGAMAQIEAIADSFMKSKVFNKFESAADIVTAIIIGNEIGLNPATAVAYGKRLNGSKIHSILKGKEMGIPAVTAMDNIHQIPTSNGAVSTTGVHIITAQLIKAGVHYTIKDDCTPLYNYTEVSSRNILSPDIVKNNPNLYEIIHAGTKKESIDKSRSQVILNTKPYDFITTISFNRPSINQELTVSYSIQQAIDAKLYPGTTTLGEVVKGKNNWIENMATMLRNRCLSIGGRIIASDYLGGVYEFSEIADGTHNYEAEIIENATILKDAKGNVISGVATNPHEEDVNEDVKSDEEVEQDKE